MKIALTCLLAVFCVTAQAGFANSGNKQFLPVDQAFQARAIFDDGDIIIRWDIADDYYLYRHALAFKTTTGATLDQAIIPDGKTKTDKFFGKVQIYRNHLNVRIPVTSKTPPERIQISYQGCADAGLCYPPQTRTFKFDIGADSKGTTASETDHINGGDNQADSFTAEQDQIKSLLDNAGLGWIVLSFLGLGLLLAFTPCVLPMIPILSSVIVGKSGNVSAPRGFLLSLVYVLAMALAYTVFGVLAGLFGTNLQALLQSPWTLAPFALVFVALSLSLFGFYELQLPSSWQTRLNSMGQGREGSLIGAGVMGFVAALIAGPCVAPPLVGALLYISASGNAVLGGLALFALGLGMGLPLIVLGTLGGGILPRAGNWMHRIKQFFGVLLIGVAIWLLARLLPGPVTLVLWSLLFAAYGIHLGAMDSLTVSDSGFKRMSKATGIMALVYAIILLVGATSGASNPLRPLDQLTATHSMATKTTTNVFQRVENADALQAALARAARKGKPAVVDFYADWCVECVQMKRTVFSKQRVHNALSSIVALQVDVTDYDADDRALLRQYNVLGPPTMLFYNANGEELSDFRLVGGVDTEAFLAHLQRALDLP